MTPSFSPSRIPVYRRVVVWSFVVLTLTWLGLLVGGGDSGLVAFALFIGMVASIVSGFVGSGLLIAVGWKSTLLNRVIGVVAAIAFVAAGAFFGLLLSAYGSLH